jgi:polyisoprenoid-binding protein YceI
MKTKWNLDAAQSSVAFSIRHMVVAKVRGRFTKFTGSLSGRGRPRSVDRGSHDRRVEHRHGYRAASPRVRASRI